MTRAWLLRAFGASCGIGVAAVAGSALGGGWWVVAAAAAVGAVTGRIGLLVQAAATIALVAGAGGDATWLIPVLVAGLVATAEAGAVADRTSVTGPPAEQGMALAAPVAAAVVAGALLWLADLGPAGGVPAALVAAIGVTAALAALTP